MRLPTYIVIHGHTYMKLHGTSYATRGWELPIKHIEERDGKLYIKNFMDHLNGAELQPTSAKEYLKCQG